MDAKYECIAEVFISEDDSPNTLLLSNMHLPISIIPGDELLALILIKSAKLRTTVQAMMMSVEGANGG